MYALIVVPGCSGLNSNVIGDILDEDGGGALDEKTVTAGLKEALKIGTERTVKSTSALDGFLGNALIRITIPEDYQKAAATLRTVGLGDKVDEFEVAMNRSAELAAAEATDVFWNAITYMTIEDAVGILNGNETAATEYFRTSTGGELRQRFKPIVEEKMSQVGLYQLYNELSNYYNNLTVVAKPALDLDDYITDKALDGLFTVLGREEKKIREDPVARTTELLRRVFGGKP
jgi:hypothetical protein